MSLSHKLIKNHQVDMTGTLSIPVSPVRLKIDKSPEIDKRPEKESNVDREQEEMVRQTEIRIAEMIRQAQRQAESLVRQAEAQAQEIREQAKDTGYREGYQKGKQDGYQAGYEEAVQNARQINEQARELLLDAHRQSREYIHMTRNEIIELAASMARSIIRINIDMREESIVEMVKNALRQAEERKQILFRCPPRMVSVFQANVYQFEKICPNATFVILEDKSIESGCIIETEEQVINLEVDKQLENIRNALLELEI